MSGSGQQVSRVQRIIVQLPWSTSEHTPCKSGGGSAPLGMPRYTTIHASSQRCGALQSDPKKAIGNTITSAAEREGGREGRRDLKAYKDTLYLFAPHRFAEAHPNIQNPATSASQCQNNITEQPHSGTYRSQPALPPARRELSPGERVPLPAQRSEH